MLLASTKTKKWVSAFLLLFISAMIWHEEIIIYLFDIPKMGSRSPVVIGVPETAFNPRPTRSYKGPHPSTIERPEDSFEFPIKLGEIGPIKTLFSGEPQYPFLCMTEKSGLGQPKVDNQKKIGITVYDMNKNGHLTKNIVGYSKDCLIPTQAWYYYNRKGTKKFYLLEKANNDIEKIQINGQFVDFIVRVETGIINRYIYSLSVLKGPGELIDKPNSLYWNKKLIYQFRGGVGIGFKQGKNRPTYMLERRYDALSKGYAVAYSSANQTSNTYNITLQEDTALRVKRQFTALYGKPEYTVGIGGSGGAIQQYLLAQNNPTLLDAIIPLYSYPDMITETIHGLDCELLEYYFDIVSKDSRWQQWKQRSLVEGLNARSMDHDYGVIYQLALLVYGKWPFREEGLSECSMSWRGPTQLIHNPHYFHYFKHFTPEIFEGMQWTHWQDLKHIYGTDEDGYPKQTWDNVGVQYGLKALLTKDLTINTFLNLNAKIGGWKEFKSMKPVKYWLFSGLSPPASELSLWSEHNMNHSPDSGITPAKRTEGNIDAIRAAYYSGSVFTGKIDLPILDVRHYNDPELDMHHSFASFSARLRIKEANGHANNHIIWMARKPFELRPNTLKAIDHWMQNIIKYPERSVADNKPEDIEDACFDDQGQLIAQGTDVWDGKWNNRTNGRCLKTYPNFMSSRNIAGSDLKGNTFKCHLQTIDEAIQKGIYGNIDMTPYTTRLKQVFPSGVCDYSKGDIGRPSDIYK